MRQTFHIFRKDVRHCWPYIAVVLTLTAANAWLESREIPGPVLIWSLGQWLMAPFIVLAWWLTIGAAVHGESLVGDRQFWVTRPYSWESLLAAKLLFFVAFLLPPVILSDWFILVASGFHPLHLVPTLLWRQCWLVAFLAPPFLAAALTRTIRETLVAGLLLCFVCLFRLILPIPGMASLVGIATPWHISVAGFFLAVCQYAQRRTIPIRVLAIALGAVTPLWLVLWFSAEMRSAPRPSNHDASEFRSIAVELADAPANLSPSDLYGPIKHQVAIPVKLTGWPRDLVTCQVKSVDLVDQGHPVGTFGRLFAKYGRDWIVFVLDDASRQTLPAGKVDLWASLDLQIYESPGSVTLQPGGDWSYLAGFGNLKLVEKNRNLFVVWRTLEPMEHEWTFNLADAKSGLFMNGEASGVTYNLPVSLAKFRMTPVFSYWSGSTAPASSSSRLPTVCTPKRLAATIHRQLQLPPIRLADYEIRQP